jgi:hypothetical protein
VDVDVDDTQLIQVRVSPRNVVKITMAQQIMRRAANYKGVPTQSEAIDWILDSFPAQEIFNEAFNPPQQVREEGKAQADMQDMLQQTG